MNCLNRSIVAMIIAGFAIPALPAAAAPPPQFGVGDIVKRAKQGYDILHVSDEDEQKIGAAVSERVRIRYGVVQDPALHRYVTLVGTVLAQASSRPSLRYQFIVLDTDGVNAFAAPGGYIHITRGALGLVKSEAELAGVLGHELIHVTEKHTMKAIQKGKLVQAGANETSLANQEFFSRFVDKATELVLAGFGREDEREVDKAGVRLANRVGYDPAGLPAFLTRLSERNTNAAEKQGLFASHPEMQGRLDDIRKQIASEKLASTATLEGRYRKVITFETKPLAEIAGVEAGAAGLAGAGTKKDDTGKADDKKKTEKKKGFGLGNLLKPADSEKKSAEVTGSAASRGVDRERGAPGGPVKTMVSVSVTAADIAAFKKEGNLK
jgi:beta-barrel assembly-enhancing protease